jgi:hypothetical protein
MLVRMSVTPALTTSGSERECPPRINLPGPKQAEEPRRGAVELWKGLQTQFAGNPRLLPYAYN